MKDFKVFESILRNRGIKANVAVVNPVIETAIEAAEKAAKNGLIKAILIGPENEIKKMLKDKDDFEYEIIDVENAKQAGIKAVELAKAKKVHSILKGSISSPDFLRPILNKETGIVKKNSLVSHISIFVLSTYHKYLIISDVAVNIEPSLDEKVKITKNAIELAHNLDIEKPKVALLAAAETVNLKMPSSIDAAIISKMGDRGVFKNAIIDGPMAMDLAISKESCKEKKFDSPVGGDADIIIAPNIDAGNAVYKTLAKLAKADLAAVLSGTQVPVVLTSRGDTSQVKYDSLLLSLMMIKD